MTSYSAAANSGLDFRNMMLPQDLCCSHCLEIASPTYLGDLLSLHSSFWDFRGGPSGEELP